MATDFRVAGVNDEYSLLETKRHKPCLIYRGYRYVQDKIQNRTVYWRCEDRTHCNGRAHQLLAHSSLPALTIDHNHPPIIDDLTRHDIITVDSHRRRRRQQRTSADGIESKNDLFTMDFYAKRDDLIEEKFCPTDIAAMNRFKSLPGKKSTPIMNDQTSRLNQFSWEEIDGRYVPIIFRRESNVFDRYTSKIYVENILFKNASWQRCVSFARSLPPLVSYSYTEDELKLIRLIVEWHLAGVQLKTIPSSDCLIRFDDLLTFYYELRQIRDNLSTSQPEQVPVKTPTAIAPRSLEVSKKTFAEIAATAYSRKQLGWIQINHVFLPYLVKRSLKNSEERNLRDREFFIPFEILLKCQIFAEDDFPWKQCLVKATQEDFDLFNHLISNINIFDEKVPEKTLLINLYHIMIGLDRVFYIKFLPQKQPRSEVNRVHQEILKLQGGTLILDNQHLIPYVLQANRFYVPLYFTCQFIPNLLLNARRCARSARQHEIDYLNLLALYFSIDTMTFPSDTLLVDLFSVKASALPPTIHFRTLQEHQQFEKKRLFSNLLYPNKSPRSTVTSSSSKTTKYQSGHVVINPLIHHPSFYGLPSPSPVVKPTIKSPTHPIDLDFHYSAHKVRSTATIKPMLFHQHSFNAIVKSSDIALHQWKISLKDILQRFRYAIDYQKFVQWSQSYGLVPLIRLDEDEKKLVQTSEKETYYIHQAHLERTVELLNDLQRESAGVTLSPPVEKAKIRKVPIDTTRQTAFVAPLEPLPIPTSVTPPMQLFPVVIADNPSADVDDDDDKMPVVATVEEEQPLKEEDALRSDVESSLIIVASQEDSEEKIHFDEIIPSSSPSNEEQNSTLSNDVKVPTASRVTRQTDRARKRRQPSRSLTSRNSKKLRSNDESSFDLKLITDAEIDQCLRTLSMRTDDKHRTRTRSLKTSTPLLEELSSSIDTQVTQALSSDPNVFDILTTSDTNESHQDQLEIPHSFVNSVSTLRKAA